MSRFEGGGGGGGYDASAIHKPSGSVTAGNVVEWGPNKTVVDSNLSTQTIEDTFTDLQANKADDVDVVHLAGVETITGQKTFTQHPHAPTPNNSDNTTHVATTAFVQSVASAKIEDQIQNNETTKAPSQNAVFDALALKANDDQVVHLSNNETIAGVKTFSSYPEKAAVYTAPTTDLQLVPKKWVDDNKMPKQPTAINNNVPKFNALGEVIDSGVPASSLGIVDGEVNTFADLPVASSKNGEIWLVKTTTGVVYVNRKVAGFYVSNGTSWTIMTPVDIDNYQKLITTPTNNNIVTTDANGQAKDSGVALSTLTATNNFDRWVDSVIGSDSYAYNNKAMPYATIAKALTGGVQFPLKIHLIGQSFTENISLSSSQPNVTIGSELTVNGGIQTQLNGTITTSSGFTRLRLANLTLNGGTSTPITFGTGDAGRHVFQNVIFQTSNASLISIPANFTNWIDLIDCDVSGVGTSVLTLPTLTGSATLNIRNLKGVLNISVPSTAGWTIYLDGNSVLNFVGGYTGGTIVSWTNSPNIVVGSVITSQVALNAVLAGTTPGLYCVSGFTPTGITGIKKGDIFYHASVGADAILYPYASLAGQGIYSVADQASYIRYGGDWVDPDPKSLANSIAIRDSESNTTVNRLTEKFINQVTVANGTLTLTSASPKTIYLTGAGNLFSVVMPDATTLKYLTADNYLPNFEIINASTQNITIKNFSGTTLATIRPNSTLDNNITRILCTDTSTQAGTWFFEQNFSTVNTRIYNTPGTYNYAPSTNLIFAIIKLVGGGGAGGTAPATTASIRSCSSGGGAGATIEAILYPSDIGTSKTIVVGVGGTGATTPTSATASTFGATILSASGGNTGGTASGATCSSSSTPGGVFSTTLPSAQIISQSNGGRGGNSFCNTAPIFYAGQGGGSSMSAGTPPGISNTDYTPLDAVGYGGGGRGSVNDLSSTARPGGNGSGGFVLVTEFLRS